MLKRYLYICLGLIAFAAAITFYIAYQNTSEKQKTTTPAEALRMRIGDKCLDFGERAVANDTPIIEFQQLQREAKRCDVIERCMMDNGYLQNPAWVLFAKPIATKNAESLKISIDEATINLGRKHMQMFTAVAAQPDYWIKK